MIFLIGGGLQQELEHKQYGQSPIEAKKIKNNSPKLINLHATCPWISFKKINNDSTHTKMQQKTKQKRQKKNLNNKIK